MEFRILSRCIGLTNIARLSWTTSETLESCTTNYCIELSNECLSYKHIQCRLPPPINRSVALPGADNLLDTLRLNLRELLVQRPSSRVRHDSFNGPSSKH